MFTRLFLADESGQAVTEYILILSAAVAATIAMTRGILKALDGSITILGAQLEKDLKTGRATVDIWQN